MRRVDSNLLTNQAVAPKEWSPLVESFSRRRIVVVGDLVADQFLSGSISRVSREAPVLILRHEQTETIPGGAANCAANLAALGGMVSLVGVVGDDAAGLLLVEKLKAAGVDCRGLVVVPGQQTTTKVRVLAGQLHSPRQQVIRIDYDNVPDYGSPINEQLRAQFKTVASDADAVVISDYDYGVASEPITATIRELSRDREIPVLVDSRHRLLHFREFATATPNEDEVEQLLNRSFDQVEELESACSLLREELGCQALLVTRGSNGMILLEKGQPAKRIAAVGSRQPIDVTGAGDTVIATYALALASGASFEDAAQIANHAGGVVVMKRGTATLSAEELTNSFTGRTQSHD